CSSSFERGHSAGVLSPQGQPGSRRADEETDDEPNDHLGRRTLEMGSDDARPDREKRRPRRTRESIGTGSQSLCVPGPKGQAEKARSLRKFSGSRRTALLTDGGVDRLLSLLQRGGCGGGRDVLELAVGAADEDCRRPLDVLLVRELVYLARGRRRA